MDGSLMGRLGIQEHAANGKNTPLWDRLHPQDAAMRDFAATREYTFGALYTGLSQVEEAVATVGATVEENGTMMGVLNDAIGDLMEEQGAQLGDMKEMNMELAETNESIALIWKQIGTLHRRIDRQRRTTTRLWMAYAVLASVTLTTLFWWWQFN